MEQKVYSYSEHTLGGRKFVVPTISIVAERLGKATYLEALIDSGATYSIFKTEVAQDLGIPIDRGIREQIQAVGNPIVGFRHMLQVKILDELVSCQVVFSRDFKFRFNLLGRNGLFDRFKVDFEPPQKSVVVRKPQANLDLKRVV